MQSSNSGTIPSEYLPNKIAQSNLVNYQALLKSLNLLPRRFNSASFECTCTETPTLNRYRTHAR